MSLRDRFPRAMSQYQPHPAMDEVDDQVASEFLRSALFESLQKFEPDVTLHAFASVRLSGEQFADSIFDSDAAEIFLRLQREVTAAAPSEDEQKVRIGFRAIAPGSVIMPLEPIGADLPTADQIAASGPAPLEKALMRVLDVHDALEQGDRNRVVASSNRDIVARLRQLIESLDVADAAIEVDLSRSNGMRRTSRITAIGRENARTLFEPQADIRTEVVVGTLRAVSIVGDAAKVELQLDKRRKAEVSEVPPMTAKQLPWDVTMRVLVRKIVSSDFAGEKTATTREFIRIVQHDEVLPEDAD